MKKQLSSAILTISIFTANALPAQAFNTSILDVKETNTSVITPGQWCFELPWMGLLCYDL